MYHPCPLIINTLRNLGWQVNPLITIATRVRGAIHKHSIAVVEHIHTPQPKIKRLTKQIHQITIQYLTYLILTKQALLDPP